MNPLELFATVGQIESSNNGRLPFPHISRRGKPNFQILTYHRIRADNDPFFPGIAADTLARQVSYLARHYRLVDLHDLIRAVRQGDPIPPDAVALTFDDGYRDNYELGLPILQRNDAPATVFLTTSFVNQEDVLWNDKVSLALKHTRKSGLKLSHDPDEFYRLDTPEHRLAAMDRILILLRQVNHSDRLRLMEELFHELQVRDFGELAETALNWDRVREMQKHRISFGVHTVTHPILTRIPLPQARREIEESKRKIEQQLDCSADLFAYPDGGQEAFNEAVKVAVRESGFLGAVTTVFGTNSGSTDLYALRRIGLHEADPAVFASKFCWYKLSS